MSAQVLREAAALIRERAGAATPSPWVSDAPSQTWRSWDGNVETRHPDFGEVDNRIAKVWDNDDSQHIASWHPDVALAVADLLDVTAEWAEQYPAMELPIARRALVVARAYLGSDQ